MQLELRLAEASAQHAAISQILQVMSASPGDVQPVLDAVAKRAARLCEAPLARVLLVDGDVLRAVAEYSLDGTTQPRTIPLPVRRTSINGRAVVDRATIHHDDVVPLLDSQYPEAPNARQLGLRAVLAVPLMREGVAYGSIFLWRREPGLFSPEQVALVETFAQQAAIAIENARLFKETKEALEQQHAAGEVLAAISSSIADTKPVFDKILTSCERLFLGNMVGINLVGDDGLVRLGAYRGPGRDELEKILEAGTGTGSAIRDRRIMHFPDVEHDEGASEKTRRACRAIGARAVIFAPMLWEGNGIGVIFVGRDHVGPFSDKEMALLKTFADQAVIAIQNARLFNETKEALEQQTATSEILRVISRSPTDAQPVFDTIAAAALKLCGASSALVTTFDGELVRLSALAKLRPEGADAIRAAFPRPPSRETGATRAILTGGTVEIPDVLEDPEYATRVQALGGDFRSVLAVPLMRDRNPIGAISVGRPEQGPFAEKQIALLKTFADQAVIAIENARLFDEVQTRTRELSESLQQQTGTADVLKVISRSALDLQTVLDTLIESACKLCDATVGSVWRPDVDGFKVAAMYGEGPAHWEAVKRLVIKPGRDTCAGRALLDGRTVHIHDAMADPEYDVPDVLEMTGNRAMLGAPLLREGAPVGVLVLTRSVARPFTEKQIALATTFADQAVIAIENVRLFKETTEALERQTATSEILRVISQSPTDVQPVFDTIAAAALKLCRASAANVFTFDGKLVWLASLVSAHPSPDYAETFRKRWPMPPGRSAAATRAILTRAVVEIPDVLEDADYAVTAELLAGGFRSVLSVPLMRDAAPIGAISVGRMEAGSFPAEQIALLQTFADQAVIAVENVRLFKELTRSVGELKALGEVGQAVSSTLDLETVLRTIVSRANQLAGMDGGAIFEYDETHEEFSLHATDNLPDEFVAALGAAPIPKGEGAIGRLAVTGEPVQIRDIVEESGYQSRVRDILIRMGSRSLLAVPLLRENRLLGGLIVNRKSAGEFAPDVIELLKTFATQSALAIQNARLFREIEVKSRELAAASRHKSEFLANMSHELRTPLNAIIGFSEVLAERMFGDINEKQADYLNDILESGRHLLSLINDILDLSKIEAGRMELEPTEFSLPGAIDNSLTLVRERAHRHGITLGRDVGERLGVVRADERKVKQVLLNLLSNALKFTPEGGRIDVRAAMRDGIAEVSVIDTGIGIAAEDQPKVFDEFRQVGTASKKVEGTGLGLAISRKFIELHGGRIWVRSELGTGSTFTFTLPLRRNARDE